MHLDVNKSITVQLSATVTTNQCPVTVTYSDYGAVTSAVTGLYDTNNTTLITIVPHPDSGITRLVQRISIYNNDTVAVTVIVSIVDTSTTYIVRKKTLLPSESLVYVGGVWYEPAVASGGGGMVSHGNEYHTSTFTTLPIVKADTDVASAISLKHDGGAQDTVIAGKANSTHSHPPSDVTGTAVITSDSRLSDPRTPVAHNQTKSTITDFAHTHPESDVTNLTTDLAGKANSSHTHAESDITNLVTDLAGKSATSHTHTSLTATGAVTSSGAGLGYATGAGGTVTQGTSRTTGVTNSKLCGTITMFSSAVAAAASSTFTLTNTFIASTDILIVSHNGSTNACSWICEAICASGSASIVVKNVSAASITEATPLKFVLIKGVTA